MATITWRTVTTIQSATIASRLRLFPGRYGRGLRYTRLRLRGHKRAKEASVRTRAMLTRHRSRTGGESMTAARLVLMVILAVSLLAAPFAAAAQEPQAGKVYRIGFLRAG